MMGRVKSYSVYSRHIFRYKPDNVALNGAGQLVITAKAETTPVDSNYSFQYSSGRIYTRNLASVQYGRVEANLSVPMVAGTWPAFWMLGTNCGLTAVGDTPWPNCGEIDIMEHVNADSHIFGTVHWWVRVDKLARLDQLSST